MKLGTKFAAEIEANEKTHADRRLQAYIQRVASPLIKNALQDPPQH